MSQATILNRAIGAAMLALMFGVSSVPVQAASDTSSTGSESKAGQTSASGKAMSKSDQDMMSDMAKANISEIEAGKLAQSKSNDEQVKNFAQRMIDDHTKAQKELQQLADAKGVTLPNEPDIKHKAAMKAMSALSGDKFDKMYMKQGGLNDHQNTDKLMARVEQRATDPDLKALAAKLKPTIDQHLSMAKEMHGDHASGSSGTAGKRASGSSHSSGNQK